MTVEIFKPVAGYEGFYEVSNRGRVRSLDRLDAEGKRVKGRLIGSPGGDGRRELTLCKNGTKKKMRIAPLVAVAFLGPANGRLVLRRDEDQSNDLLTNLHYGDVKLQAKEKIRNGRTNRGEKHPLAKLTEDKVRAIRQLLDRGSTIRYIGALHGVSPRTISDIKRRKTWGWLQ